MNKKEKLELLKIAMTRSTRSDGTEFDHFADSAPEELKNIYLSNYEVRDLDYQIFSRAIDAFDSYNLKDIEENIIDGDFASPYITDRLDYLNMWNQEEISQTIKELGGEIQDACAYWYDDQVRGAVYLILREYINK